MAVRPDELQGNLARRRTINCCLAGRRGLAEKDVETASQPASRHQAIAPPSAIGARDLTRAGSPRAMSSYASDADDRQSYTEIGSPLLGPSASGTGRGMH